jgi:molybdate transport system ATP-binding protein
VALARALIGTPRFLFLDEPFSALDAGLRVEARAVVGAVIAKSRVPTLLISHDLEDLRVLASTRVEIADGRLVAGAGS